MNMEGEGLLSIVPVSCEHDSEDILSFQHNLLLPAKHCKVS